MSWIKVCLALTAMFAMGFEAHAGKLHHRRSIGCGAEKACGCASDCTPASCKPSIKKPCHRNVHSYQRGCAPAKPAGCTSCAPTSCCAPAACAADPGCDAPCAAAPACAAPAAEGCCGTDACTQSCCKTKTRRVKTKRCTAKSCTADSCSDSCGADDSCGCTKTKCSKDPCAKYDPRKLAQLIYEAQTACYPRQRKRAVHQIGSRFNCKCNPEVMTALIYSMNDANPYVRREATDEIGDQIRKNGCCCTPDMVKALSFALADCDRVVRREAEQALNNCGYEVVGGCCKSKRERCCKSKSSCCETGCADTGCTNGCAPAAPVKAAIKQTVEETPAPTEEAELDVEGEVPAPPVGTKPDESYFPVKIQKSGRPIKRNTLANLFGFLD